MEWLQILFGLLFVFGLLALLYWASLRYGGRGTGTRSHRIEVLERRSLGDKSQLVLVQVGGQVMLLGSTPHSVSILSQLEASPEPLEGAESAPAAAVGPNFRRWLELLQ